MTTAHRLRAVEQRLRETYGQPRHHNPDDPLDDLIFVVLSRMTQEVKYTRTYDLVREQLPSWETVRKAGPMGLEPLLRDAGLARTKAEHICELLDVIEEREGRLDLEKLRAMSDDDVEGYLTALPGVGTKTAACVMLYALQRQRCPVDAHVWRIMQRLGVAEPGAWTPARARDLEHKIPDELRASLHVTFIAHGRAVCLARRPRCDSCVIADLCPSADGGIACPNS